MARPVTLFTGQWADLPLATMAEKAAEFGYDGLELACWGDHFDPVKGAADKGYCDARHELLGEHGLRCWAISNHLVGQAVCDPIDERHKAIVPPHVWGDGEAEGVRQRAADEMKATARAAANLGVPVVNGFTGSAIWHKLYFFPPTGEKDVKAGFDDFAERWGPIFDVFQEEGVKFALEVHPSEIAYDIYTAERALEAVGHHPAFGFNFDPSHLIWQGMDPARFIDTFPDRIYHVHMKDTVTRLDGTSGILSSHLGFGDPRRGWDFRSVGRGDVNFEEIIRALNRCGYDGPLSVEWEDSGMDREHGATESCEYVRNVDFTPSARAFDAAFED
ncbi:MAG: sugar phosphate isomerase/epimerase [Planctomycetota bacterium]|nr:MAG: sugar phosphate isomerase/epimerase [Planctomycetota bacterium]